MAKHGFKWTGLLWEAHIGKGQKRRRVYIAAREDDQESVDVLASLAKTFNEFWDENKEELCSDLLVWCEASGDSPMLRAFKTAEMSVGDGGWALSRYEHCENVFFEIMVRFIDENGPVWGDEFCVKITGVLEDDRFYVEDKLDFELISF